jgi:hypothetical protein
MLSLAGIFAFSLPAWIPSITTPVGAVVWTVLIVVGISVLVAVLHILYFVVYGLTFIYLWIKGMFENRAREENKNNP